MSSVPANARWAIERFKSDDEGKSVADAIKKGCCMGVSDGSFKGHFGMACWILKPKDQAGGTIRCPCVVPGGGKSECIPQRASQIVWYGNNDPHAL